MDQIGLNWIKLDQIGSNLIKIGSNVIKLLKLGGGGLSPTPSLSFALSSLVIEKLGLSLKCLKIFKLVYIGTTKMPVGTNNWDVKTYGNKLENIFTSLMCNVFWYLRQLDGVIDETNHLSLLFIQMIFFLSSEGSIKKCVFLLLYVQFTYILDTI